MQTCSYKPVVKKLRKLLKQGGIAKHHLPPRCPPEPPGVCPCKALTAHARLTYQMAAGDISAPLLLFLGTVFDESGPISGTFHPKLIKARKFWCPEIGIYMYQACSVTSCRFHTKDDKDWTGNCILRYLVKQKDPNLKPKGLNYKPKEFGLGYPDLTFMLDKPTSELRASLLVALRKMRNGALKEIIVKEQETGLFERIDSRKVCSVCEAFIRGAPIVKRGYSYCSQKCVKKRPPKVLQLEHEFCISFERLITICRDRFNSNLSYIATALNLSKSGLIELCNQCGMTSFEWK